MLTDLVGGLLGGLLRAPLLPVNDSPQPVNDTSVSSDVDDSGPGYTVNIAKETLDTALAAEEAADDAAVAGGLVQADPVAEQTEIAPHVVAQTPQTPAAAEPEVRAGSTVEAAFAGFVAGRDAPVEARVAAAAPIRQDAENDEARARQAALDNQATERMLAMVRKLAEAPEVRTIAVAGVTGSAQDAANWNGAPQQAVQIIA